MSYNSMTFLNFMLLLFFLITIALLIATLVLHSQYTESSNREEMETKRQKRNNLAIATGVFGGVTISLLIMRIVISRQNNNNDKKFAATAALSAQSERKSTDAAAIARNAKDTSNEAKILAEGANEKVGQLASTIGVVVEQTGAGEAAVIGSRSPPGAEASQAAQASQDVTGSPSVGDGDGDGDGPEDDDENDGETFNVPNNLSRKIKRGETYNDAYHIGESADRKHLTEYIVCCSGTDNDRVEKFLFFKPPTGYKIMEIKPRNVKSVGYGQRSSREISVFQASYRL